METLWWVCGFAAAIYAIWCGYKDRYSEAAYYMAFAVLMKVGG